MFYQSRKFTTLFLCIVIVFINGFQRPDVKGMKNTFDINFSDINSSKIDRPGTYCLKTGTFHKPEPLDLNSSSIGKNDSYNISVNASTLEEAEKLQRILSKLTDKNIELSSIEFSSGGIISPQGTNKFQITDTLLHDSANDSDILEDQNKITEKKCRCQNSCLCAKAICNKIKSHPCLSATLGTLLFGGVGVVVADAATDHAIFKFIENLF